MDDSDEELYRKYSSELLRFAAVLIGPGDADDIVSAAFLRAFSSPRWSAVEDHRPYLYRAVLNESRQTGRSSRRRLARELSVARSDQVEPDDLRLEVAGAVASLSMQQRAVVYLTYWFGMTASETATALGLSQRATERHLHSARVLLRRSLQ